MKRGSKTTPAQLAAMGLVEGPDGHWRKAVVKDCLTPEPAVEAPAPKGRGQWAPYRNKTEWRFAQWLAEWGAGPGRRITYEALRLPLASIDGKPSYYMPDFQAWRQIELVSIYEVKGGHRWRRQGIDRLRAAAAAYPEWEWYLVEWVKGEWSIKRVEG